MRQLRCTWWRESEGRRWRAGFPAGRHRGVAAAGWAPRSTWWRSGTAVRWGRPGSARGRWSAGAGGHPRRVAHRAGQVRGADCLGRLVCV